MVPLDRALLSSYRLSIVTISLSVTVWPQSAMHILTGVLTPKSPLPVRRSGPLGAHHSPSEPYQKFSKTYVRNSEIRSHLRSNLKPIKAFGPLKFQEPAASSAAIARLDPYTFCVCVYRDISCK